MLKGVRGPNHFSFKNILNIFKKIITFHCTCLAPPGFYEKSLEMFTEMFLFAVFSLEKL